MSEKTFTTVLHVQLDGTPLPDPLAVRLTEGWVDASVNVPSAFQLTFSDKDGTLTTKFPFLKVGAMAVLSPFTDGRLGEPMLTGEVTAVEVDATPGHGRYLIVRGYDPGHRLLRSRRVEGYPNMTASDIVRKLAGLNRIPIGRIDATPTVYELATQPNITDWDFLSRLARENDVRLSLDTAGRLVFAALPPASSAPADTTPAAVSPYVLDFGSNTLQSRVSVTAAGQVGKVDVRGWDPRTKQALSSPTPAATSREIVSDITPAQLSAPFGPAELAATETPFTTQSEVTQAATALADDVTGSFAEVEVAVTGNPALKPGQPVAVKGAGFPFEGRYTATGVRHVFASGRQFATWLTVSGRQFRSLYGTASGGGETAPPMPGVAVALVTNTKDPLSLGRVRLRFPWLSATYESGWCRVAQLGGRGGGGLMLPEVDDEVLCAFDRGSLEHPYVLAGLYNGVDKHTPATDRVPPVDPTSGRVQWRAMTSRTGHTVELREEGGRTRASHGIRLRTAKGGLSVELNEARTTLTIDSDGTVTITGARGVTVESGMDLTLSAKGRIKLDAGLGVDIKAGAKFKVSALTQAVVNAPAFVTSTVPMPNPVVANLPF
ncbi:VgrG-related protein [Streptomyces zaomyceticus]|uniref:VgrG-related protein n=1 Tax=Streptomyces zaomyceticus TaxID=68286 RepID=UPI00167768C6|nr:VgrG-related protein [Streptomyces zaomyceticus]GHG30698.1 type IV secretion protein Rhs [Streptomyces zaomyceticus]